MKKSIYTNPKYCLSFSGDTVFLDIEVEILKITEESFKMIITKAQLDPTEESFPIWLVSYLSTGLLTVVFDELKKRLTDELTPSLFTLFYAGEVQPDATDLTA